MSSERDPARSGLVVVDKPAGMTSHDVVARVRRAARTRKVGHAGTLDPMATGVLLLGVNRATRLLGHLTLADKRYDATVRLGYATTTDDAEGERTHGASAAAVSDENVRSGLATLTGEIDQVPCTVSAIKVDGKRAYARARDAEEVVLPPRRVRVHSIAVGDARRSTDGASEGADVVDVDISVHCSSGTYIRAIARDLGEALGVGGHLTALRRTAIGGVGLDEAVTLEDLDAAARDGDVPLLSMAEAGRRFFEVREVDADAAREVGFGRRLRLDLESDAGPVAVLGPDGDLLALYAPVPNGTEGEAAPVAVFAPA